jgi:hypothetical protein
MATINSQYMEQPAEETKPGSQAAIGTLSEGEINRLAADYSDMIDTCLAARADQEQQWKEYLESYKSKAQLRQKSYPWENCSNLTIGLSSIYVDTVVAKIVGSVNALEPTWVVQQLSTPWARHAKPLERYLDWSARYVWEQYPVVKSSVLEMSKLGTCIMYTGWKDQEYWARQNMTSPATMRAHMKGPCPQWVAREDFVQPPEFPNIEGSPFCAHRMHFSWADLQALEHTKDALDIEIDPLKGESDDPSPIREMRQKEQQAQSLGDEYDFGLWAVWQVPFCQDLDQDGYPEEYIMLLHKKTKTILRLRPNPYPLAMRPYIKMTFIENEGEFDGMGIPEMVADYQAEVSTIHNQRRDQAHLANTVMFKARRGSGITDRMRAYPGKIFIVNNMDDLQEFPISKSYMATVPDEQMTISLAERRIGISDMNLGRESSPLGRAAATTVLALMQENTKRFDLNTAEVRMGLSEEALQICELWQTHGLPQPQELYSPESFMEPQDAALVREILSNQDGVRGLVTVKINAASAAVNREIEKQDTIQLYQIGQQHLMGTLQILPQLLQSPPPIQNILMQELEARDDLFKRILRSHQIYDLDSVLMSDVLSGMVRAAQQAGPPVTPTFPGGPAGQGPPATGMPQVPPPGMMNGQANV